MAAKEKDKSSKRKRRAEEQVGTPPQDPAGLAELRAKLECTVCCHMMFPPVRQCAEGHNMCEKCCSTIMGGSTDERKCPTCRIVLRKPVARSRNLEDWATQANVEVLCDFADCGARFGYATFGEHMQTCPGRTVECPITGCTWRGNSAALGKHLSNSEEHGFNVTKAPYRPGRVTLVRVGFESKRSLTDESRWRPKRQLIELSLPGSKAQPSSTVTFCLALWKPDGAAQPLLSAVQQLRRASCDHGIGWGCELILSRQRHAARLASPAADLDSCDDVWVRPNPEKCIGPVLLIPTKVAKQFNEVASQHGVSADGIQQKYEVTVKLWSEWGKGEGHAGELPAEVFEETYDMDGNDEGEESEDEGEDEESGSEDESDSEDEYEF